MSDTSFDTVQEANVILDGPYVGYAGLVVALALMLLA